MKRLKKRLRLAKLILLSYKTRGLARRALLLPYHHHHRHPRPRAVVARPSSDLYRSHIRPHQPLCASCEGTHPRGARGEKTRVFFRHVLRFRFRFRFRFLSFYLMVPFFSFRFYFVIFSCCHDSLCTISHFFCLLSPPQWWGV